MKSYALFPVDKALESHPAIICGDMVWTFADLATRVGSCMAHLRDQGVVRGDRIALVGDNSPGYLVTLLSLWHLGATVCPQQLRLPTGAIIDACDKSGCGTLIADRSALPRYRCETMRTIPFPRTEEAPLCPAGDFPRELDGAGHATIIRTSGSGGTPKAALHSIRNHVASAAGSAHIFPVGPGKRWLISLPFFHVGGIAIIFRTLPYGAAVVFPADGETVFEAARRSGATHLSVVNTQLLGLAESCGPRGGGGTLPHCEVILAGGSAMAPGLVERSVRARLPLHLSYGSTEMSSQIATTGKIAAPAAVPEYRVLPYREVSVSEKGEIRVRGLTLFQGYVTRDGLDLPLDRDGWFLTGDSGAMTGEASLAVSGRIGRMFISGGENIHPEEIEAALLRHPDLASAHVVAVPDDRYGERPVAFISLRPGASCTRAILEDFLRQWLPGYMVPDRFYSDCGTSDGGLKPDYRQLSQRAMAGDVRDAFA